MIADNKKDGMMQRTYKPIGEIGNYYGGLIVKKKGGRFYWGIVNYDGTGWEEISKALYDELKAHKRGETHDTDFSG